MGYLEENLINGESVKYQGRQHWIVLFWPAVTAIVFAVPGAVMVYQGAVAKQPNMVWLAYAGLAMLGIAAVFLIRGIWRRNAIEFAVTNKRIIVRQGLLERKTQEILLHKIESIGVDQGLTGRMLNYGTVTVRGTGGTFEPFPYVQRALELRRQVQEQIAGAA